MSHDRLLLDRTMLDRLHRRIAGLASWRWLAPAGLLVGLTAGLALSLLWPHPASLVLWAALLAGLVWAGWEARPRQVGALRDSGAPALQHGRRVQDGPFVMVELAGSETDLQRAADYAARVQQRVGSAPVPGDYWKTATVGEVMLLQRRFAEAGELYAAGVAMAHKELGSHRSTWRQACHLMRVLQPSADEWALVRKAFAHLPDCDAL